MANLESCRICLKSCDNNISIFDIFKVTEKTIRECIEEICDISMPPMDNVSENLCRACYDLLEQCYTFRLLVRKNATVLHEMYEMGNKQHLEIDVDNIKEEIISIEYSNDDELLQPMSEYMYEDYPPPSNNPYQSHLHQHQQNLLLQPSTYEYMSDNSVGGFADAQPQVPDGNLYTGHNDLRKRDCPYCKRVFLSGWNLRKHLNSGRCRDMEINTGIVSDNIIKTEPGLEVEESRPVVKEIQITDCQTCPSCGKRFTSQSSMLRHHNINCPANKTMPDTSTIEQSDQNQDKKVQIKLYPNFMNVKRLHGKSVCPYCKKGFSNAATVRKHLRMKRCHSLYVKKEGDKSDVLERTCPSCSKVLSSYHSMLRHHAENCPMNRPQLHSEDYQSEVIFTIQPIQSKDPPGVSSDRKDFAKNQMSYNGYDYLSQDDQEDEADDDIDFLPTTDRTKVRCPKCKKMFSSNKSLRTHLKLKRCSRISVQKTISPKQVIIKTEKGNTSSNNAAILADGPANDLLVVPPTVHVKKERGPRGPYNKSRDRKERLRCPSCKKKFSSEFSVYRHHTFVCPLNENRKDKEGEEDGADYILNDSGNNNSALSADDHIPLIHLKSPNNSAEHSSAVKSGDLSGQRRIRPHKNNMKKRIRCPYCKRGFTSTGNVKKHLAFKRCPEFNPKEYVVAPEKLQFDTTVEDIEEDEKTEKKIKEPTPVPVAAVGNSAAGTTTTAPAHPRPRKRNRDKNRIRRRYFRNASKICPKCNKEFCSAANMERHLSSNCRIAREEQTGQTRSILDVKRMSKKDRRRCILCRRKFCSYHSMLRHYETSCPIRRKQENPAIVGQQQASKEEEHPVVEDSEPEELEIELEQSQYPDVNIEYDDDDENNDGDGNNVGSLNTNQNEVNTESGDAPVLGINPYATTAEGVSNIEKTLENNIKKSKSKRTCPHCSKEFSQPTSVRKHLKNRRCHVLYPRGPPLALRDRHCGKCGKELSSWHSMVRHEKYTCRGNNNDNPSRTTTPVKKERAPTTTPTTTKDNQESQETNFDSIDDNLSQETTENINYDNSDNANDYGDNYEDDDDGDDDSLSNYLATQHTRLANELHSTITSINLLRNNDSSSIHTTNISLIASDQPQQQSQIQNLSNIELSKCTFCTKKFDTQSELEKHIRFHECPSIRLENETTQDTNNDNNNLNEDSSSSMTSRNTPIPAETEKDINCDRVQDDIAASGSGRGDGIADADNSQPAENEEFQENSNSQPMDIDEDIGDPKLSQDHVIIIRNQTLRYLCRSCGQDFPGPFDLKQHLAVDCPTIKAKV